jgi:hypothetical protein
LSRNNTLEDIHLLFLLGLMVQRMKGAFLRAERYLDQSDENAEAERRRSTLIGAIQGADPNALANPDSLVKLLMEATRRPKSGSEGDVVGRS